MIRSLPSPLVSLAKSLDVPLYLVGGSVRDFLAGNVRETPDYDICAPLSDDALVCAAQNAAFAVRSVFRATGTVKLADAEGNEYEFTRFRSDKYVRGMHRPSEVCFTDDISLDAVRRDFCANAVYYDIKNARFVDPLGGMDDIEHKILRTVAPAEKVFGEDGLRLLRLARIAAQTGFTPDAACIAGARENAALIADIVPERIFAELNALLHADEFARENTAPYRGLHLLKETNTLRYILPELDKADGMPQRSDFHNYGVLEHSFRCVLYAPRSIRWAALLHDVGKPFCFERDGNFYAHDAEGERLAREILARLKAPKKLIAETALLVKLHMRDYALNMREAKVRRELVSAYPVLEKLFALKQADYSACKDELSPAPCVEKWKRVLADMKREGAPLTPKELQINGNDLLRAGVAPQNVGSVLDVLFAECVQNGALNDRAHLLRRARTLVSRVISSEA